ncbi:WxL domain-containing protein [Cellulomonas hominis]|nr:hypothetical protein AGMMS50218_12410 [Actinomycetota bacterium]
MRKSIVILPLVLGFAGAIALAGPASAADTPVTLAVAGGNLGITAPVGAVALPGVVAGTDATDSTIALGDVTVSDERGGEAGWVVSAVATAFAGPVSTTGAPVPTYTGYAAGVADSTGVVTVTATDLTTLDAVATVESGTAVTGVNVSTWSPTIDVTIPAGTLAGAYTSTITHSVL